MIVILIGNKCDVPNREVPYNVAMDYARKQNFGYLEVSAKTGFNIWNAFKLMVRMIYVANHNPGGTLQDSIGGEKKEESEKVKLDKKGKGKKSKKNSEKHCKC